MATSNSRPFAVSDAMLIIAIIAVGLALSLAQFELETNKTRALFSRVLVDTPVGQPPVPWADSEVQESPDQLEVPPQDSLEVSPPDSLEVPPLPPEAYRSPFTMRPTKGPTVLAVEVAKTVDAFRHASLVTSVASFLTVFSLAFALLCLRSPRPRFKHLVLSIRFIPVLATATHASSSALSILIFIMLVEMPEPEGMMRLFSGGMTGYVGGSIAVIWIGLVLSRRFRIRGWLDWLGLAIGIAWISAGLFGRMHFYTL
ncbi:hypothetical protein BSF38_04743 [Paludisphaera borealis]|uniref:Uncharacterized protein n=1 Tax=Paludisphaera borealis TaxID=1387353 RepID=A0A1U7CW50_9BACT|nr:hypothetical protein BSF38_04743 [Paludisphaera borealis]